MRNILLALCLALIYSCSKPTPIDTYTSDVVWFAKFKRSYGGSDPMKQVTNSRGLFIIKRFDRTFEISKADTQINLTIDSFKRFSSSTRFFLKNERHQLFQLSIYADSIDMQKRLAHIEFSGWNKPYYSRFMDRNPAYVYTMNAVKQ